MIPDALIIRPIVKESVKAKLTSLDSASNVDKEDIKLLDVKTQQIVSYVLSSSVKKTQSTMLAIVDVRFFKKHFWSQQTEEHEDSLAQPQCDCARYVYADRARIRAISSTDNGAIPTL
ncbi:hypothetical protein EVAR_43733_1 [Eumeta japonica]|uniref:Uncharacterized protein n=1 Tax=Eumeta variegata TaxID=151549 RepID=A0A4C1Y521_EUMVA|nr:hypothetical protein EVAR_43733_1 [Eumeta japonica]